MRIFLSYASQDKEIAESIAFSLRGRGHKVFLDRDNLPPGGSYDQQIESAVNDSDVFVFLVSPDSVAHGRYSLTELTFARRKWPDPNGRVLPVMARNTPLEYVPPYLRAVSLLEPIGNITAEASSAVDNMRPTKRRSDGVSLQNRNARGLWIAAVVTFIFIATVVEHPVVNGWDIPALVVPFYIAVITYAVFSRLDNNASDEATKVITSWLRGRSQNKPDLGNLIIKAFDRIYTSPLLSIRAFYRSYIISIIIWILLFLVPSFSVIATVWYDPKSPGVKSDYITVFFINLGLFIGTDYFSLFFVRYFLQLARKYPMSASLLSSTVGIIVIEITYLGLRYHFISSAEVIATHPSAGGSFSAAAFVLNIGDTNIFCGKVPFLYLIMAPAFVIHLWLPLFALSSLVVRLVFWIFRAVEWAQWFLKQGDAHPLKAIGVVATIIVFVSAMLVKEAWTVM